jgi:hypothetical protein
MRYYYYGSLRFNIGDMLGKTFKNVINDNDDRIIFTEENGDQYIFCHIQDCCESVTVRDVVGHLSDLIGSPLLEAEETSNSDHTTYGSETWTFYKFGTIKGHVNISWIGESNGYYSESVDHIFVKAGSDENH